MVSRRATLVLLGSALGGCLGDPESSPSPATDGASPARDDSDSTPATSTPPDGWPPAEWTPDWTHSVSVSHVLGLDVVDGRLLITAADNRGPTVVQSYDPGSRYVVWSQTLPMEAMPNSRLEPTTLARVWGVTDAGHSLLSVTGTYRGTETELHALDAATGEVRWSLERERSLAVRGLVDDTVYVVAEEVPATPTAEDHHGSETDTPTPHPASLLAVDLATGSVRWERAFPGIGAAAADDAGVYVAVLDRLVGLAHDGTRRWRVGGDARGTAVYPGPDTIFHVAQPAWNRMVVRGVGHDGTVRWETQVGADESVRFGDRLYAAHDKLEVIAADGSTVWTVDARASRLTFSPKGEWVYIRSGGDGNVVTAVDLDNGGRSWSFTPPIGNAWPESATEETVVAGGIGEQGKPLYRIAAASGVPTARYLDADPGTTQPLGEHVFVATSSYDTGGSVLALPL